MGGESLPLAGMPIERSERLPAAFLDELDRRLSILEDKVVELQIWLRSFELDYPPKVPLKVKDLAEG